MVAGMWCLFRLFAFENVSIPRLLILRYSMTNLYQAICVWRKVWLKIYFNRDTKIKSVAWSVLLNEASQ